MEVKMNKEILDVICAVVDYKKWICSDIRLKGRNQERFDWYKKTEQYYIQIEKPKEMGNNTSDFDRVLFYSLMKDGAALLERMCEEEEDCLEDYNWK